MRQNIVFRFFAATFVILSVAVSAQEIGAKKPDGSRYSIQVFSPEGDNWDFGAGLDARWYFWESEKNGSKIAFTTGFSLWDAKNERGTMPVDDVVVDVAIEGDALLWPVGLSVSQVFDISPDVSLILEAGASYVVVSSNVTGEAYATDGMDSLYLKDTIYIDDSFVGQVSADVLWNLNEKSSLSLGIGYQFDITKGDVSWWDTDIGENEFGALFVQVGVALHI